MSEKSRKLKVKGLSESITESQLSVVLGNKRRQGGGSIDHTELIRDGDSFSAIVTFEETEAVDIILSRGDTVEIKGVTARVKRYFDSSERKPRVSPPRRASKTLKTSDVEQVESHDDSGKKSLPEMVKKKVQMPSKKNLKIKDQPLGKKEHSTLNEDSKPRTKGHKANSHSSDDERISSIYDSSQSESLPTKPKNKTSQKSTVKKKQSGVNKRKESDTSSQTDDAEQVYDNSESESLHEKAKFKARKPHKEVEQVSDNSESESIHEKAKFKARKPHKDVKQVSDNSESESIHEKAKFKAQKPHKETTKKKTECLSNRKYSESVKETKPRRNRSTDISQISSNKQSALFHDSSESESSSEKSKSKMQKSVKKSTAKKEQSLTSKTSSSQQKRPKYQRKESNTKAQTSDDEHVSDLDDTSGSDSLSQKPKYTTKKSLKGSAKVNKSSLAKRTQSGSEEDLVGQWEVTIKAKVKDLNKSKDFYILYFEDDNISQGHFFEESFLLDGLNRNLYVTFQTKEAAVATASFKHKSDSNLLKVEMATKEDFDTYTNLLSVHGQSIHTDDQRQELISEAAKQTQMEVVNIIQHEEPRSAIIVFNPETCQDVSAATWISLFYKNERMILAPVFKTNCVKMTGMNPMCSDDTLKRYMSNNKRSGGGEVKNFLRQSKTEALVTFKERESFDGVLGKSQHNLEGCELHINIYYECLGPEVYRKQIELITEHVVATNNTTLVNTSHQVHNPRGRMPLVPEKTSLTTLRLNVGPLCTSVKFDSSKNVQYTLQLCKFGTAFLTRHPKHLQQLMQSNHCKYVLSSAEESGMTLKLDWPHKTTLKDVRNMLKTGLNELRKYLDTFREVQCNIDKFHIHEFQKFCQTECQQEIPIIDVYFDHVDNLAVFISDYDEPLLKKCVNKMHHNFMSNNLKVDDDMKALFPKPRINFRPKSQANVKGKDDVKVAVSVKEAVSDQLNMEQTLDFDEKDIILFQKTNFHKEVEIQNKPLEIIFNSDNMHAIIKGKDMNSIQSAQLQLLEKARNFVTLSIRSMFSPEQLQLLNKQDVQSRINNLFAEKGYHAHFRCNINAVNLFYVRDVDDTVLKEIIDSHVILKKKTFDGDMAYIFKSEKGQKFLSDLCETTDGVKMSSQIKVQDKFLEIITSSQQFDVLIKAVDHFAEENKSYTKTILFSSGKQLFVKKFLPQRLLQITDSVTPLGAKVIHNAEGITVQGLKDGVSLGETQLSALSEQILVQDISLKYFGIKEFLQTMEGKSLLASVENNKLCVIKQATDSGPSSAAKAFQQTQPTKPNLIAHAKVGECSFLFMQGDLTSLDADAIVNPLDSTLKCQSGLGKALILRGGPRIQFELASLNMQGIPGEVRETSAGNLEKCRSVVHVVCPVFTGTEMDVLKEAIKACLEHTESQGIKSLAIPAMGTGKIFKFPPVVACKQLMKSIHQHLTLTTTSSSLTKICLCDVQADHVKELIERFKNIFGEEVVEVGDLQETPTPSKAFPPPPPKPFQAKAARAAKNFRNIKVKLITGEIAKQKTDVIVVTVGRSLELSKGGMTKDIVKYGSDTVQQELTTNCGDVIHPGEFGTTSGGNLQCKNIYYARLNHWRGNSEDHMNKLVYKLLQSADQQGASSISIPAMGTGKLGYPPDIAADAITNAICQFAMDNPKSSLTLVNLVVYKLDTEVKQAFETILSIGVSSGAGAGATGDVFQFRGSGKTGDSKQEKQFKSVKLKINKGDITAEKCDAIISGIRDSLDMSNSGAVCKALLKLCGSELQDELNAKKDEMTQNGIVATSAPNLNCKQIYHVSMDKFSRSWDKCVSQVLTEAESQGIKSIALPALGTGARNADYQQIKQKIYGGLDYFSKRSQGSLKDVRLVFFSQDMMDEFLSEGDNHKRPSNAGLEADVTSQSLKKVSDHVELKVYAESHPKIVIVRKELNDVFNRAFKEEKEKDKEVKRLNKHEVQLLESEGMKHCVLVSISVEEGLIIMKGFKTEGFMHVLKLLKTLVVAAVTDHHVALQKAVVAAIQWQFEQPQGKWRNFEPILNSELEKAHKHKSKHHDITDSRDRTYRIDFSSMKEFEIDESGQKIGHRINVRRHDLTREGEPLPKMWDHMDSSENLKLVTLSPGTAEYKNAEQLFIKGGATNPIKKIQRIQNKSLYQQYKVKKREMDQRNPKGQNNEQRLFHGTDSASVTNITTNGFNRSFCGKNATMHGNGVYFAVNSSYSVSYAQPSPLGERLMYIARVLTGVSTPSNQGMTHLPNKPGTNNPYDSGSASGMYIIFHDAQAYPEYLITF